MAFAQVTKAISKGEFSKEDFKNLLEVYEDGTEKLKVKFEGKLIEIDIQKELSINENIINSQLRESPSSYYVLASLRDKYIKERDALAREKKKLIRMPGYIIRMLMRDGIMNTYLIRQTLTRNTLLSMKGI